MAVPAHLLAAVQPVARTYGKPTGHERRRGVRSLPQTFYVGNIKAGVQGMVVLSSVQAVQQLTAWDELQMPLLHGEAGDDMLRWQVTESLLLAAPQPITDALVRSMGGSILQMKATAVALVRGWTVANRNGIAVQGSLSQHHLGVGLIHRLFLLSDSQLRVFSGLPPVAHLLSKRSYVLQCGISDDTVGDDQGPPRVALAGPMTPIANVQDAIAFDSSVCFYKKCLFLPKSPNITHTTWIQQCFSFV
jgi:hypothetical protein